MAAKQKILIVDDDVNIAELISLYLTKECFDTKMVHDGESALKEFETYAPNLILLDLMLPGIDGYQVCREIRAKANVPIIMLSAKGEIFDKVLGLELGADDYLTKPFYLEELKMRIQALLKRSGKFDQNTLSFGDVRVNLATNSTFVGDKEVELLGKEFDLLVYFLQNQNVILPKSQIFDRLWGFDSDTNVSVVEVYVSKIRKKFRGTDFATNLQTLRSVGYILKNAD